jgi:hypothetical protein
MQLEKKKLQWFGHTKENYGSRILRRELELRFK